MIDNSFSFKSLWRTLQRWVAQLLVLLTLWLLPLRTLLVNWRSQNWTPSSVASPVIPFPVLAPEWFTETVPQPEEADRRGLMVEKTAAGDRPPQPGRRSGAISEPIPASVSYLQEDLGDRTRYRVALRFYSTLR